MPASRALAFAEARLSVLADAGLGLPSPCVPLSVRATLFDSGRLQTPSHCGVLSTGFRFNYTVAPCALYVTELNLLCGECGSPLRPTQFPVYAYVVSFFCFGCFHFFRVSS